MQRADTQSISIAAPRCAVIAFLSDPREFPREQWRTLAAAFA